MNTGTEEEPILELAMLGRIVEEATCETGTDCLYTYALNETPIITNMTHSLATNAGDNVTVEGTYDTFDLKSEMANYTAEIGGEAVVLEEHTEGTGFTFLFPALVHGSYSLALHH